MIESDTLLVVNIYISLLNKCAIGRFLTRSQHILTLRSLVWLVFIGFVCVPLAFSQVAVPPETIQNADFAFGMDTEVGILRFENSNGKNERYISSVLAPTLEYGDWRGGLRLRYRWNGKGLRDEDYDSTSDYLSILRFVQYREKDDQGYYGRLGDVDDADIGYGQFVNRFRNTLSLNEPQTGITFDYLSESFTFEGMWSNLAVPEVYAFRASTRPYREDTLASRKGLAIGITLAGDLSDDARWENSYTNGLPFFIGEAPKGADSLGIGLGEQHAPLTMLAFDAGLAIPGTELDSFEGYVELANIFGFGSGLGLGLEAEHQFPSMRVKSWFEQRLLGREYVPGYFNSRYEFDRIGTTKVTLANGIEYEAVNSKRNQLKSRDRVELGSFLGMEFRFKSKYRLKWSLENSWSRKGSGWFEIDFLVADPDLPFQFRYIFDRVNMGSFNDILYGPKENGLLRLEVAYMVKNHLLIGFQYRESFESVESLGRRIGQKKRISIQPSIIIRM